MTPESVSSAQASSSRYLIRNFEPPPNRVNNSIDRENRAIENRVNRYIRQSISRALLPDERVSFCLRKIAYGKSLVKILYDQENHRAHYGNLAICGSVWHCPVCASKITSRRAGELRQAIMQSDFTLVMMTLTLQHSRDDRLTWLLKALSDSFAEFHRGKPWQRKTESFELAGYISGLEQTIGDLNGFHPHKHILFFSRLKKSEFDYLGFQSWARERWIRLLDQKGFYASEENGLKVSEPEDQSDYEQVIADYVTKWGLDSELVKSPVKSARDGNYSPFQLLDLWKLYSQDNADPGSIAKANHYADLWREYASAMKGRKQLFYSHGLRELLGLGKEKTDEEIANEKIEKADVLALLTWSQWKIILERELRGELVEVASTGNLYVLSEWLRGIGINLIDD